MRFRFTDRHGRIGHVTEGLNVEYEGAWKQDVTECIERINQHAREEEVAEHFFSNRLLIGLYTEVPIDEVEQIDGSEST